MKKEKISWRTFDDDGSISKQWNRPPTPMVYILDHEGRIRRKWAGNPGEKTIDAALEELIDEAALVDGVQ